MKPMSLLACFILLAVIPSTGKAYDVGTHARMSWEAYLRAQINQDSAKRAQLGLRKGSYTDLGTTYCDVSKAEERPREAHNFDWSEGKFPAVQNTAPEAVWVIPPGWLMRGAVREDDAGYVAGWGDPISEFEFRWSAWPPQDDPYGNFNRFCNHFFDPLNNRPLSALVPKTLCWGDVQRSAPRWALGLVESASTAGQAGIDSDRRNHFALPDAREAMWQALTLTRWTGSGLSRPADYDEDAATRETLRTRYWATTFRALGDVLHLVQDMAQPQHTRNEGHPRGEAKRYEEYIDWRARGTGTANVITIDGETIPRNTVLPLLEYQGYPIPRFAGYFDYWSTGTGSASSTGQGLADYTNRGFLTIGSIRNPGGYPKPPSNPELLRPRQVIDQTYGRIQYWDWEVPDTLTGARDLIHMTRKGLWYNKFNAAAGPDATPTRASLGQDLRVFDDYARLLIPRAVAYSAGVLDYFFRGSMQISIGDLNAYAVADHAKAWTEGWDPRTGFKGFDRIRLKVKNTTPDIVLANGTAVQQDMRDGRLVAVVKFHRNTCYQDDLSGEPTQTADIARCRDPVEEIVTSELATTVGGSEARSVPFESEDHPEGIELSFRFAQREIPFNAWDVILQVVYRGQLGEEDDAVVVASKDISEPTFIHFFDMSDCYINDPPGTPCSATGSSGKKYGADLYIQPKFPMSLYNFGITLSLGQPSAPQHIEQNFPGRITRIAGLFDVNRAVEMRRFVVRSYYGPLEDPTATAVFLLPSRIQIEYEGVAAPAETVFAQRFKEVPVAEIGSVMWWYPVGDGGEATESTGDLALRDYLAGRLRRLNFPASVPILNW